VNPDRTRKRREAEQADGHGGDLDRQEERDPMQRENQAVDRKREIRATDRATLAQHDGRKCRGCDHCPAQHDDGGRQREPFAEQSGKAEQDDGDMQRNERRTMRSH